MMHDQKESAIFQAAIDLFAQKGFERTTMEEIAAVANVSKGTLFYRYTSKEELFVKIVRHALDRFFSTGKAAIAPIAKARDKLALILSLQIQLAFQNPNLAKLLFREVWGIVDRYPLLRQQFDEYLQYLRVIIDEGIASGELRELDSEMLAVAIFGMTASATMQALLLPEIDQAKQMAEELQRVILQGIEGGKQNDDSLS